MYVLTMKGVKSKNFGVFWSGMLMISLCFPNKIDLNNKEHLDKIRHFKMYYNSLQYVIPCYFCRCFIKEVLMKHYPLQYTSKVALMKSIYIWKKTVSTKLQKQGNLVKPSPPFAVIKKRYEKMYANCDKKLGSCV
jgi:hypothetical protein